MILVTGANGFVGSALVQRLIEDSSLCDVVVTLRRKDILWPKGVKSIQIGDLLSTTDWSKALEEVNAVVHCAARVHVMHDSTKDHLEIYRQVNVLGTLNLARQAAKAGVRRFVFLSSIKVNGEITQPGRPFTADDVPAPMDPYGISKQEAEHGLLKIAKQTGMELVIVRSPLVYGPGVKANFASMMRWVDLGLPLPFGAIHNSRSMVALDNLVNMLITCLKHFSAAGQIFMVSDGRDLSTTELLQHTAEAMGKKIILLPAPTSWLKFCATLIGKRAVSQRLCGFLQVDIEKTRRMLGWTPPFTLEQGIKKTVEAMKR